MPKCILTFEWNDGLSLELRSKWKDESSVLVVKIEENQHFKDVREEIESICTKFLAKKLKLIGDEMIST